MGTGKAQRRVGRAVGMRGRHVATVVAPKRKKQDAPAAESLLQLLMENSTVAAAGAVEELVGF